MESLEGMSVAERKNAFVRIGFENDPESFKQLPRFRLTTMNVNRVFNCDVEYLVQEGDGKKIWPKQWASECHPSPVRYFIREKIWPLVDPDAMKLEEYRGMTVVVVDNVPDNVAETALKTWLMVGLDEDDPDLAVARMQLEDLQEQIARVDKQIKDLPLKRFPEAKSAKEELDKRKQRSHLLAMQRTDLEADIKEIESNFETLRSGRDAMTDTDISLRLAETKYPLKFNVWEARFSNSYKGQRTAYLAAKKNDWSEFRLAVHKYNGKAIASKLELPSLPEEFVEINMRTVSVSRRMHGIGMFRYPDERGFYSGHFRHGLRYGTGTEVNQMGKFQGMFHNDWRSGPGTQVYSQGDVFRGTYGTQKYHLRESLFAGDEYGDGMPNGRGKMRFTDGSVYEGSWIDGKPAGHGKYIGANGVIIEGEFGDTATGCLEGFGSMSQTEVTRIGAWRSGLIHGYGMEIDAVLGTYEGDFVLGEKSGMGSAELLTIDGRYRGWWLANERFGQGAMNYGNIEKDGQSEERRKRIVEEARKRVMLGASDLESELQKLPKEVGEEMLKVYREGRRGTRGKDTKHRFAEKPPDVTSSLSTGVLEVEDSDSDSDIDLDFTTPLEKDLQHASKDAYAPFEQHQEIFVPSSKGKKKLFAPPSANRLSAYEKMQGPTNPALHYLGDYGFEGRWVRGTTCSGGILYTRYGRKEPNLHTLNMSTAYTNKTLFGLQELLKKEEEESTRRAKLLKDSIKVTLDARLVKEAENHHSFTYWRQLADSAMEEVKARTLRGKSTLIQIEESLRKPVQAIIDRETHEAAFSDVFSDDNFMHALQQEEEEETLAGPNEQSLMV